MVKDKYVRFDWAAKRMLRDKANFDVLEGLVTVLLGEEIHIEELLESEGNQDDIDNKFNRVDIKAKNSKGEIIIVEIQLTRLKPQRIVDSNPSVCDLIHARAVLI